MAELQIRATKLDAEWNDLAAVGLGAAERYEQAQLAYHRAIIDYGHASSQSRAAAAAARLAERQWELFLDLVLVATAIDAANIDKARRSTRRNATTAIDCSESMSPAAYRLALQARGISLVGKEVDHILPKSLGGADHPANYRLIPAGLNRSLGNRFDEQKCMSVGAQRCARAVEASKKCGSLGTPSV